MKRSGRIPPSADWSHLRLEDRIKPGLRVLFVGINPGVRSAQTGHHFAGPSNRFWKLLREVRLVPEPLTFEEDGRLPEFGFGITNLVTRPSPGINDLKPIDYIEGWKVLEKKIRKYRPEVVALVGVTLYRAILPLVVTPSTGNRRSRAASIGMESALGLQPEEAAEPTSCKLIVHGARLFVLPNPSGRNANFSYAEMLSAFGRLRTHLK